MEIFSINTGYINMKSKFHWFPEYKEIQRYPVLSYLIRLKNKNILFDTGLSQDGIDDIGVLNKFVTIEVGQDYKFTQQLKLIGIDCGDIDYVINSHLHFDHCGNNRKFIKSKFLIQKDELTALKNNSRNPSYIKAINLQLCQQIEDGYSIFEDNSARLFKAKGHTAGHQILVIESGYNVAIFLGDSCYFDDKTQKLKLFGGLGITANNDAVAFIENIIKIYADKKIKFFYNHDINFNKYNDENIELITSELIKYKFGGIKNE
ncbi:N-acyl homoserine lactonase family protein [Clostridium fungisolvens]|uniref:N-acyl homoserine lactonase n=1 Tax=Clostridium fungisolvens TaxID=1604897 RepID=A0A6V8SMG2_9CLOT|nr:N-acyl homoserine lactonase family protein [Clostridium fungisolvens]GFP77742.1 N-acyl homoserine lactonase [Clostridium fungisolvens]